MLLVDTHTHYYPFCSFADYFDLTYHNMRSAADAMGSSASTLVICLLETEHSAWYQQLLAYATANQAIGKWQLNSLNNRQHLQAVTKNHEKLIIVPGRQMITAENLEVLIIGTTDGITYRLSAQSYIEKYSANHLVIIPWGIGKWLGQRGRVVSELLELKSHYGFALGDNSGRTPIWRNIPQFNQAKDKGINILAGTDPLPIAGQQKKLGTYGVVTNDSLTDSALITQLREQLLVNDPRKVKNFGKLDHLFTVMMNQLLLRIRPLRIANMRQTNSTGLNILMVAPQPFFSARGTPFSVLHRIRALIAEGHRVDLITYPFGENIEMEGLRIFRSRSIPFIKKIKIGPSVPKILLDIPLIFATIKALRSNPYDVVHSHEEAAFFCAPLAKHYSLTHIYDMHSSLPQQLSNFKAYNIGPFRAIFEGLENYVLNTCDGVITICDDLARVVNEKCPNKPHSMIENIGEDSKVFKPAQEDLVSALSLVGKKVVLYTGTFEAYQGIDLLLEAMTLIKKHNANVMLVLVGGTPEQVEHYRELSRQLSIQDCVCYVGTVHPSRIPNFLNLADVIVSPRSRGTNTPLKIYGYMRTRVPLVATDRHTHTQILNHDMAELVPATAEGLANGIIHVLQDPVFAAKIAGNARQFADENFSDEKYIAMVAALYRKVLTNTGAQKGSTAL